MATTTDPNLTYYVQDDHHSSPSDEDDRDRDHDTALALRLPGNQTPHSRRRRRVHFQDFHRTVAPGVEPLRLTAGSRPTQTQGTLQLPDRDVDEDQRDRDSRRRRRRKEEEETSMPSFLPGFVTAAVLVKGPSYPAPTVPSTYCPVHIFTAA